MLGRFLKQLCIAAIPCVVIGAYFLLPAFFVLYFLRHQVKLSSLASPFGRQAEEFSVPESTQSVGVCLSGERSVAAGPGRKRYERSQL